MYAYNLNGVGEALDKKLINFRSKFKFCLKITNVSHAIKCDKLCFDGNGNLKITSLWTKRVFKYL